MNTIVLRGFIGLCVGIMIVQFEKTCTPSQMGWVAIAAFGIGANLELIEMWFKD